MANYALPILSGLFGGAGSGLATGMFKGEELGQRQQQIDEQKRQFDASRATDTSSIGIPGMTPNALIPYLLDMNKRKEEATRKATLGQGLADQLTAAHTTTGMAPGASVEMPQPGAMLAPPAAGPMPAMTQKTVDPKIAALAKFLPMLAQIDPTHATGLVKDQLAPGKPQIVGENARGMLQGDKFTEFPQPPAAAVPPGMVPKSFKQSGTTYEMAGGGAEGKTLSERVAIARAAFAANPTPEAQAALGRMEEALRVETGLAGARSGATGTAKIELEPQEFLSPEEAGKLGVPYGTRKGQAAGKTPMTATQQTKMDAQSGVLGMIDNMERELKGIKLPSTPSGRVGAIPGAVSGVYGQTDPKLAAFHSRLEGSLSLIVRALGEVGTLTDKDLARARSLQPVVAPIPDTDAVVKEKLRGLRQLVKDVAGRAGTRMENPTNPPTSEPLSRRDPRYQQLRQRGLDDQRIQQQFGVTVTD